MMAFDRLEPMGSLHGYIQAGQICAVLANLQRDEKTKPEPYTAEDFMPYLRDVAPAAAADEPSTRGDDLSDDDFERLFDAVVFGRAPQ